MCIFIIYSGRNPWMYDITVSGGFGGFWQPVPQTGPLDGRLLEVYLLFGSCLGGSLGFIQKSSEAFRILFGSIQKYSVPRCRSPKIPQTVPKH